MSSTNSWILESRRDTHYFHANPWCHVRFDLDDGRLLEMENSHPTPDSLYRMCDPDYVVEHFRDDLYVQIEFAMAGGMPPMLEEMKRLDELMGLGGRWDSPQSVTESADRLFWRSGMKASEQIVQKALRFARDRQKKLLVLVSYRGGDVAAACDGKPRLDEPFVEFLNRSEIPVVDSLEKHVEDFRDFGISTERYLRRYYNGHYAPAGNHFFAFAIKDDLVAWLDPVPLTYRKDRPSVAEVSALLARSG